MRLKDYDYSTPGYYFVTICVKNKDNIFGIIENEKLLLNEFGKIAFDCWKEIPLHFKNILIDEFIIMPNHIHGIIIINNKLTSSCVACNTTTTNEISLCNTNDNIYFSKISPKSDTLSVIIRSYKSAVTKKIHDLGLINFQWQKLFYDHIIRNEKSLYKINNYIKYNYLKWKEDEYYNN